MNVGDHGSRSRVVEREDIARFTAMTGDRNPLHCDRSLAAASRFGWIIVQGGVTTGLLNALVAEDLPGPGSVFLNVNWHFRAPTRPGDVITAHGTIVSTHSTKPICTMRTWITNQLGAVLVDGTAVVYREPLAQCQKSRRMEAVAAGS